MAGLEYFSGSFIGIGTSWLLVADIPCATVDWFHPDAIPGSGIPRAEVTQRVRRCSLQPRRIANIVIASGGLGLGCLSLLGGCGDESKTTGTQVQSAREGSGRSRRHESGA